MASRILLLDHLNLSPLPNALPPLFEFYQDILGHLPDQRRETDRSAASGTVWMNAGATQFHLSPGPPTPNVLDGRVHLHFSPAGFESLSRHPAATVESPSAVSLRCPYGNSFLCSPGPGSPSHAQPGAAPGAACRGISSLELFVVDGAHLAGIARFYERVFGARGELGGGELRVPFGLHQAVTFREGPVENGGYEGGFGPHVSLYVDDLRGVWESAAAIDPRLIFVNPRFANKAYTIEQAEEQCIFRLLEIVDPEDPGRVLLRMEHEVTSAVTKDGGRNPAYPREVAVMNGGGAD